MAARMTTLAHNKPETDDSFDDDGVAATLQKRGSRKGIIITLATVIVLVAAVGLTLLGRGAADTAVTNFDASSWLFSSDRGEADRVNAVTARVDTRAKITDTQNHDIQITQTDKYLILRDLDTGQVSALDLTTLQVSAKMDTTPGLGVTVALHGESAFVIDAVQGQVRQLDPRNLAPVGDAIALPNGIAPGGFDGQGTLWIAVPTEGTVVAIAAGAATATSTANPKVLRTVTVSPPGHDLVLSAMDEGVAVLDNTDQILKTIKGATITTTTSVPIDQPAVMSTRTSGPSIPVTILDERKVVVVTDQATANLTVPGTGPISAGVAFAGRIYVADALAGIVYVFDLKGTAIGQVRIPGAGGPIELEVREGHLFINAPNGSAARVINDKHEVKEVNKYQDGVVGADPPPIPKDEPKQQPLKARPGKPLNVSASAGNGEVRVTWRKANDNGAPITKYVVIGGGKTITVGAKQRSAVIKDLTNGKSYRFTVHAVNAIGEGPKATSPPVTPTADVPLPPASVTATANANGTVTVTWPGANGLGRKIARYTVTSITNGVQAPVGDVTGRKMTIAAGSLSYGEQYAFTVVAVNDRGAGSDPSPISNTIVPFNKPGQPTGLRVAAVRDQRGAVQVTWGAANSNGRAIEKYVVDSGSAQQDVTGTSATFTGLGDDQAVAVTVHAVNEAGAGPGANATGRTIGVPTLTVTGTSATYNGVSVTLTPNDKGGIANCRLQVPGGGQAQRACGTAPVTLTVNGLWPNSTYDYTVTVTTAAGSARATGTRNTSTLRATVICDDASYCGRGVYIYSVPSQANQGNAVGTFTRGNQFQPECRRSTNPSVDARPWGGRDSTWWLRLTYQGATAWFPFAWANTDGGNNLNLLRTC